MSSTHCFFRTENRSICHGQGRTQDLELGGAQVAYPGYKKWGGGGGGGGRFRPDIRKVGGGGGGGASGPIYEKWGGGGGCASGPIYEKWGGGGGGGGRFKSHIPKVGGGGEGCASGPIYEKWGGGGAFRFRYLWAYRKYLHIPTYVLPRYTSHARANESKIHAGKGFLSSIC